MKTKVKSAIGTIAYVCAKGALKVLINLGFILSLDDEAFIIIDEKESNLFFVNWI